MTKEQIGLRKDIVEVRKLQDIAEKEHLRAMRK